MAHPEDVLVSDKGLPKPARKVRGVEEAIDRVNQTNHEKAVLAKLQDLGLMLNERNVRKVEGILHQENQLR